MRNGRSPLSPFEMATERLAHTTFVRLYGEFDLDCEEQFRGLSTSLAYDGFRRVVLDLRGLTFIDSTGLRLILDLWRRSRHDGFDFALVRGAPAIQRVLVLVGLDGVLPMVDDRSPLPARSDS